MVGFCYYQEKGVSGRPKHSKTGLTIVHFLEYNLETTFKFENQIKIFLKKVI